MISGKVVIQILVYCEPFDMIDRLFASLERVAYPQEKWELMILNNVHPAHRELKAYIAEKWLPKFVAAGIRVYFFEKEPNLGFAGGHQWLYERALELDSEFVYLLNSDAVVDPEVLSEVVAHARVHPKSGLIQSRVMLQQEPELLNSYGNAMHFLGFGFSLGYRAKPSEDGYPEAASFVEEGAEKKRQPMFYPSGAGVLVRVSTIQKNGGLFDYRYFLYHEDSDVGWRTLVSGHDVSYASKSVIYHQYEFAKSITKFYWMERNRFVNLFVFYRLPTLVLIAPLLIAMEIGTLGFAILKGGWWREKLKMWMFFWKPSSWRWIAKRRALVKWIRTRSDREMLEYMVGDVTNQEVESFLLNKVVNPCMRVYFRVLKFVVRW